MVSLRIALRYLKSRNKFFLTSSNMLSLGGIFIGVLSLIIVSSVMNGFENDMVNRIIGSKAEIKISKLDFSPISDYDKLLNRLSDYKQVLGVSGVCQTELMLQRKEYLNPSLCFGIDLDDHKEVTNLLHQIRIGHPTQETLLDDGIILGLDLSLQLNVTVGEYIQVSSPVGTEPTPFGLLPRSKKLKVIGIFISGMPEYDKTFSYISLKNSQYFIGYKDVVETVDIKTVNSHKSKEIARKIQADLGDDYLVEDWSQFEANLFQAMAIEKLVMFIVLLLMIVIASFNMSGNFIKLVVEKKTEIGILKALGATNKQITRIFVWIGVIIGLIGTTTGFVVSLCFLWLQSNFNIIEIPVSGFPIQHLPVSIEIIDLILIPFLAILISILTTIYPAKKTTKVEPISIIRKT